MLNDLDLLDFLKESSTKTESVPKLPRTLNKSLERGTTGLKVSAGYVHEEFIKELRTLRNRVAAFTEMSSNEPLIAGVYFAIKQLIKNADWRLEPAGKRTKDRKSKEFIEGAMDDMEETWEEFLEEALSFVMMGFAPMEIVYKVRGGPGVHQPKDLKSKFTDGKIGWRKMPLRGQNSIERWDMDHHGNIHGLFQRGYVTEGGVAGAFSPHGVNDIHAINQVMGEAYISINKMLLFRNNVYKNNPEGQSAFRASWVPYYYKKRISTIEAIGIERELGGMPVGRIPGKLFHGDATVEEKASRASWEAAVRDIRADDQGALLLPSDRDESGNLLYDFELMSAGGRRAIDTETVIDRLNREILIPTMADFILLGHESVGSYALSSDKTHLFAVAIAGYMKIIANQFNKHAIPMLMELNGMDPTTAPKLCHGDLETEPIADITQAILNLYESGVINEVISSQLLRRGGVDMDADGAKLDIKLQTELVRGPIDKPEPTVSAGGKPAPNKPAEKKPDK